MRVACWVEKALAGLIFCAGRHVGLRPALDHPVEGELELDTIGVISEDLPKRGAGHLELPEWHFGGSQATDHVVIADRGERYMVDCRRAQRRLPFRAEGRTAAVEMNDRLPDRSRHGEPGTRIAEIGSRRLREPNDVPVKADRLVEVGGLDSHMK